MSTLILLTTVIGVLLLKDFTSKTLYIILFGIGVGVLSATGWPSCLYVIQFVNGCSYYHSILIRKIALLCPSGMDARNLVTFWLFSSVT